MLRFRSYKKITQQKIKPLLKPIPKKSFGCILSNIRNQIVKHPIFYGLGSAIAFLASVIGIYSFFQLDVSILPYTTRDADLPMETRFLVQNNSFFSIYHARYNCEVQQPLPGKESLNFERVGVDEKDELLSKGSFTIYCGGREPDGTYYKILPDEIEKYSEDKILNIYFHFSFLHINFIKDFGFGLQRDKDGKVIWLPLGASRPLFGIKL